MIAKYNGLCKITNQRIVAGETEIKKINGQWQVVANGGKVLPFGSVVTSYGNEYLPHEVEEYKRAQREDGAALDEEIEKWEQGRFEISERHARIMGIDASKLRNIALKFQSDTMTSGASVDDYFSPCQFRGQKMYEQFIDFINEHTLG